MSHVNNKINIAVIDDDRVFQLVIKTILEENPCLNVALQCHMGSEFFKRYSGYHIDIIILDIDLPGEDGLEIAQKLTKECGHIPVLVFSALDHPRYNSIFYSLGVKKCIVKNHFTTLETEILEMFQLCHLKSVHRNELAIEENRLLNLICDDYAIETIAEKLMIGVDAAKKRKSKLANKLQIKNKDMHFLKWGIKHGYYYV